MHLGRIGGIVAALFNRPGVVVAAHEGGLLIGMDQREAADIGKALATSGSTGWPASGSG